MCVQDPAIMTNSLMMLLAMRQTPNQSAARTEADPLAIPAARAAAELFVSGSHDPRPGARYQSAHSYTRLLLSEWQKRQDPWVQCTIPGWSDEPAMVAQFITAALCELELLAQNDMLRRPLVRQRESIALRVLASPAARRLLAQPTGSDAEAADRRMLAAIRTWCLPDARSWRRNLGILPTDEWGVLLGCEWSTSPADVIRHAGEVYVSLPFLWRAGIQAQATVGGVRLATQYKRASALARRRTFASEEGAADTTWVPLAALTSGGMCDVEAFRDSQMLVVTPCTAAHSTGSVEPVGLLETGNSQPTRKVAVSAARLRAGRQSQGFPIVLGAGAWR